MVPKIIHQKRDMGDYRFGQTGRVQAWDILPPQQIVCRNTKCIGQMDEHIDGRLDIVIFPIGYGLF